MQSHRSSWEPRLALFSSGLKQGWWGLLALCVATLMTGRQQIPFPSSGYLEWTQAGSIIGL